MKKTNSARHCCKHCEYFDRRRKTSIGCVCTNENRRRYRKTGTLRRTSFIKHGNDKACVSGFKLSNVGRNMLIEDIADKISFGMNLLSTKGFQDDSASVNLPDSCRFVIERLMTEIPEVYDEQGNLVCDSDSMVIGFEIYYVAGDNWIDCCTINTTTALKGQILREIKAFVGMYI